MITFGCVLGGTSCWSSHSYFNVASGVENLGGTPVHCAWQAGGGGGYSIEAATEILPPQPPPPATPLVEQTPVVCPPTKAREVTPKQLATEPCCFQRHRELAKKKNVKTEWKHEFTFRSSSARTPASVRKLEFWLLFHRDVWEPASYQYASAAIVQLNTCFLSCKSLVDKKLRKVFFFFFF